MRVRVLAFASAADALGAGEIDLELPPGSPLAALREELDRRHPALAALWPRLAVAVNGELAAPETALRDGAEVALLPPVSGGAADPGESPRTALPDVAIDPAAVLARVAGPGRGAIVVFAGTVRDSHGGRPVERITYVAYRRMALAALERIARELEAGGEGMRVAIVHRLGTLAVGEASVVIAVASPHRAAAYDASRRALERLKAEAPIWKREHYAGGATSWREEEPLGPAAPRPGASGGW